MTRTRGWDAPMATADPPRRLARFTRTERAVHWVHAGAFVALLASGLCLYLPALSELVGRRPLLKAIHFYVALAWLAALLLGAGIGHLRGRPGPAREGEGF